MNKSVAECDLEWCAYLQAHSIQWEELKGSRNGAFLTGRLTHSLAVSHRLTLQITVEYGTI